MRIRLALALALVSAPALAYGPGVHVREARRTLELLADTPEWAAAADHELAQAYLALGAISPDFQHISTELTFGHSKALSYHLLDTAANPEQRLFALGHLAHICSDASAETFLTPTLWSSQPLGMVDLFVGENGATGESEGICEGFGDFVLGDWDTVIDALYDLYLGGEDQKALFEDILLWYCTTGAAFSGQTDCEAVLAEVEAKLDQAKSVVGVLGKDGAKELLESVISLPPPELIDAFTGGFASSLLGEVAEKGPHFTFEVARLKESAVVDPAFWAMYEDEFADLGPVWTVEHLAERATGWPAHDTGALIGGNLESIMRFLPDDYAWGQGLRVDDVAWLDAAGQGIAAVGPGLAGATLTARVRLFAARAKSGTVRAVVRADMPGLWSDDPIVGEAQMAISEDPYLYTTAPRPTLAIPFVADVVEALGYTLEVHLDDEARPFFTTSFDRMWGISTLPLDWPVYRDNFGTYGHWPPSLPLEEPSSELGAVFVKVRVAPAGGPIAAAACAVDGVGTAISGESGLCLLDLVAPGPLHVSAGAEGYEPSLPVGATLSPRGQAWVEVALFAIAQPALAGPWLGDPSCVHFTWNIEDFDDQAAVFEARLVTAEGGPLSGPLEVAQGAGEVCAEAPLPDGAAVRVALRAVYEGGVAGAEAQSAAGVIDGTAPVIADLSLDAAPEVDCLPADTELPALLPARLVARVVEPTSQVVAVQLSTDGAAWQDLDTTVDDDGSLSLDVELPAPATGSLWLRATNAAGHEQVVGPTLWPAWGEEHLCEQPVEPEPDAGAAEPDAGAPDAEDASIASPDAVSSDTEDPGLPKTPDTDDDAEVAPDASEEPGGEPAGANDGCGAAPGSGGALAPLLALVALLARGIRRRGEAPGAGPG